MKYGVVMEEIGKSVELRQVKNEVDLTEVVKELAELLQVPVEEEDEEQEERRTKRRKVSSFAADVKEEEDDDDCTPGVCGNASVNAENGENENAAGEHGESAAVSVENAAVSGESSAVNGENAAVSGESVAANGESGENATVNGENAAVSGESTAVTGESGENAAVNGENGENVNGEDVAVNCENGENGNVNGEDSENAAENSGNVRSATVNGEDGESAAVNGEDGESAAVDGDNVESNDCYIVSCRNPKISSNVRSATVNGENAAVNDESGENAAVNGENGESDDCYIVSCRSPKISSRKRSAREETPKRKKQTFDKNMTSNFGGRRKDVSSSTNAPTPEEQEQEEEETADDSHKEVNMTGNVSQSGVTPTEKVVRVPETQGVDAIQELGVAQYVSTASKPYLTRRRIDGATWWEDEPYSQYLRDSVIMPYMATPGAYRSWTEAPQRARDGMYTHFARRVRIDLGYDLRSDYESRIKKRITDIFHRAVPRAQRPEWIPEEKWTELKRKAGEPEFKKKVEVKKINRRCGQKDGVAKPTSCLGSRSAAKFFKKMGPTANPIQIVEKTKKGKDGKWIDPRAPELVDNYDKAIEEARASQQTPNTLKIFHDVSGGYNLKNRFWGIGSAAKELFRPCLSRSKAPTDDTYFPTAATQERAENEIIQENLKKLEERQQMCEKTIEAQEKRLEEQNQFIEMMKERWAMVNEGCSSGPRAQRRDDNAGDGHAFGSSQIHPLT